MWWDEPKRGIPMLILLGVLLGVGYNFTLKAPLPWVAQPKAAVSLEDMTTGEAAAGESSESEQDVDWLGIPESQFPINISLETAKELYDSGKALFLDAREEPEYIEGHIKGAESAPYDIVAADPDWLDAMAAKKQVIVTYCDGGECELSINLGFAINQSGHNRVCVFEDGYPAWKEAGYATRMGDKP